jgi:hypothetical protein
MIAGFVLLLAWLGLLRAEEPARLLAPGLIATVDKPSARLGETVRLTLAYRLPEGARLPEKPQIDGLSEVTVLDRQVTADHIIVSSLVDLLDTWKTQDLSLTYLDKEGNPQKLTAPAVTLPVVSNLGDKPHEARLRPIEDIIPTRSPWLEYLPWAAHFFALAALCLGLLWWRRKKRLNEIYAEILEPPHIRARNALERLNREMLFENGQIKGFYFRFSEILRQYLGAIRGFGAAELTTEEIAAHITHEVDRPLLDLLRQADLVKFADAVPGAARKQEQWFLAVTYIEKTSPPPENGTTQRFQEGRGR